MSLVWDGKNVGFWGVGTRFYTVRVQKIAHAISLFRFLYLANPYLNSRLAHLKKRLIKEV